MTKTARESRPEVHVAEGRTSAKIPVGPVQDDAHEMNCEQATYLFQLWTGNPVVDAYFRDHHHVTVTWGNESHTQIATWLADALTMLWNKLVRGRGLGAPGGERRYDEGSAS